MIELKNITKSFGNSIAVNNISFSAEDGCITGIIGSNGSGKSTTMRLIATLLKQDSGYISINGTDTLLHPNIVRSKIGILLGGDISLYERLTARENIMYFAQLQGLTSEKANYEIKQLSALLGMDEFLDRRVAGFSRGMRQKVAFVRSIIHSPDVLLLDEPSTGLDINSISDVQNFILYCKSVGKTILLSTHNAHEMNMLCDNLVFIDKGRILAQGNKKYLLENSKQKDVTDLFFYYTGGKDI